MDIAIAALGRRVLAGLIGALSALMASTVGLARSVVRCSPIRLRRAKRAELLARDLCVNSDERLARRTAYSLAASVALMQDSRACTRAMMSFLAVVQPEPTIGNGSSAISSSASHPAQAGGHSTSGSSPFARRRLCVSTACQTLGAVDVRTQPAHVHTVEREVRRWDLGHRGCMSILASKLLSAVDRLPPSELEQLVDACVEGEVIAHVERGVLQYDRPDLRASTGPAGQDGREEGRIRRCRWA